ncbi:hypothetical protein E2C01_077882 [Portunus trituberculatus]|uniref:Uncharacterized protein n=1 Tax=Portunus trituberculatus TaxID=210409 RepID=A0A5B7IH41_PORTR|nr:hypothetical protein [Portunus trituberculatus]
MRCAPPLTPALHTLRASSPHPYLSFRAPHPILTRSVIPVSHHYTSRLFLLLYSPCLFIPRLYTPTSPFTPPPPLTPNPTHP